MDEVTLTMKDGTKVLVLRSQIKRKLPYYNPASTEDTVSLTWKQVYKSYNAETIQFPLAQEKKEKEEGEVNKTEEAFMLTRQILA